jgi:hypothetical protein
MVSIASTSGNGLILSMAVITSPFNHSAFGNNAFSSVVVLAGGNPDYGKQHLVEGTIPAQGENLGIPSSQGPWNPWQGSVPSSGMSSGGNPFHSQWNPMQGSTPIPIGSAGANPSQSPWNVTQAQHFTSYYGSQFMTSQQVHNLYIGHSHGYYQNLG